MILTHNFVHFAGITAFTSLWPHDSEQMCHRSDVLRAPISWMRCLKVLIIATTLRWVVNGILNMGGRRLMLQSCAYTTTKSQQNCTSQIIMCCINIQFQSSQCNDPNTHYNTLHNIQLLVHYSINRDSLPINNKLNLISKSNKDTTGIHFCIAVHCSKSTYKLAFNSGITKYKFV